MIQKLRNKPLIINSDLDGILSGLLLKKYLNCSVVGFSNSNKTVWLNDNFKDTLQTICFVDLYIAKPNYLSIDQHIISANEKHHNILVKNANKINPNLLNPRFHFPAQSYKHKYPFGTVHFIIALLENEGIDLEELDLFKSIQGIQLIDLILRADDTLKTTVYSAYKKNANAWWQWLIELSNNGKVTAQFKKYLDTLDKQKGEKLKFKIGKFLRNSPYNCDTSDGGIKQLTHNYFINESVFAYFELLAEFINVPLFDLGNKFKKFNGIAKRMSLNSAHMNELIDSNTVNGNDIFSYAFVRSAARSENFSVTFYQKNN